MKKALLITVLALSLTSIRSSGEEINGKDVCKKDFDSFKSILAKDPSNDQAWTRLRVCAGELKRWNDAVEIALNAKVKNPDLPQPLLILGMAQMQQKNYERAIDHFDQSLALKHDQPVAYFQMGMAHLFLNHPKEAALAAEQAVDMEPTNGAYHRQLAYTKYLLEDLDTAETEARKAVEINADDVAAYKILAKVYAQQGRQADSDKAMEQAMHAGGRVVAATPVADKVVPVPAPPPPEEEKESKKEDESDVIEICATQWNKMRTAMLKGNLTEGLTYYSDYLDTRQQYRDSFTRMGNDHVQEIFSDFGDLYDCEVVFAATTCKSVVRNPRGMASVATIRFERNPDHVWRIRSF